MAGSRSSVYLLTVVAKFIRPKRSFGRQVFQAILEGVAGLGHAFAAHAAGGVEHEDHVARNLLRLGQLGPRRHEQHEVAVLAGAGPMRQRVQADVLGADVVEELEIAVDDRLEDIPCNFH